MIEETLSGITLKPDQPIAQQLKSQVRALIALGELEPGARLPTVSDLAGYLRINRNTVASAYQQLEQDGFVESVVGRGTFVAESAAVDSERQKRELFDLADRALDKVYELGFDPQDYVDAVTAAARKGRKGAGPFRALFVECTLAEAQQFSLQIEEHTGISVIPVELGELESDERQRYRLLRLSDLIVTTFFHVQEVRAIVGDEIEVLALGVSLPFKMLMELGQLPAGSQVALVCEDERCLQNLRKSILNSGLDHLDIRLVTELDEKRLRTIGDEAQRMYACPPTMRLLEQKDAAGEPRAIEFQQQLDRGGLDLVREYAEKDEK